MPVLLSKIKLNHKNLGTINQVWIMVESLDN